MNNDSSNEIHEMTSINDALDQLGMLSTITQSRKDYIQENENLLGRLQHLNMSGEMPGPSCNTNVEAPLQKSFIFNLDKSKEADSYKVGILDLKEKENKVFEGLHIVTMNSQFITSFKTGYTFPLNELSDSTSRRVLKCNMRKRKFRPHPYEKKPLLKVVEKCINTDNENLNELDQTACRLRTASLSSGTCNSRRVAFQKEKSIEKNTCGLQRSRSMENLTASKENASLIICDKAKDIETVSKGIQEMQVEDCT